MPWSHLSTLRTILHLSHRTHSTNAIYTNTHSPNQQLEHYHILPLNDNRHSYIALHHTFLHSVPSYTCHTGHIPLMLYILTHILLINNWNTITFYLSMITVIVTYVALHSFYNMDHRRSANVSHCYCRLSRECVLPHNYVHTHGHTASIVLSSCTSHHNYDM